MTSAQVPEVSVWSGGAWGEAKCHGSWKAGCNKAATIGDQREEEEGTGQDIPAVTSSRGPTSCSSLSEGTNVLAWMNWCPHDQSPLSSV